MASSVRKAEARRYSCTTRGVAVNTKAKALSEGDGVSFEVANRGIGGSWAKNVCRAAS